MKHRFKILDRRTGEPVSTDHVDSLVANVEGVHLMDNRGESLNNLPFGASGTGYHIKFEPDPNYEISADEGAINLFLSTLGASPVKNGITPSAKKLWAQLPEEERLHWIQIAESAKEIFG